MAETSNQFKQKQNTDTFTEVCEKLYDPRFPESKIYLFMIGLLTNTKFSLVPATDSIHLISPLALVLDEDRCQKVHLIEEYSRMKKFCQQIQIHNADRDISFSTLFSLTDFKDDTYGLISFDKEGQFVYKHGEGPLEGSNKFGTLLDFIENSSGIGLVSGHGHYLFFTDYVFQLQLITTV